MKNIIRHIRQSLSLKLSLGILLMAMPIFVVSLGIVFLQSRQNIKREAMERVTSVLNTTAQRVNRFLSTVETATNANEWMVKEQMQPDMLMEYSRRIVMLNANVNGCSITTEPYTFPKYGRYFSAYSVREGDSITTVREGEYEYFDKVWYKTPKELGKATWVDPFDDFNEGTLSASDMIASYCKPLYDQGGTFIGVISTDLSLTKLSKVIQGEKPYPNAYYVMLGERGHIFVHPDSTRLVNQTIFSGIDARYNSEIIALGHEMTSGHQGAIRIFIDGKPCLVCYQPVAGTKWSLAIVCPDSDILKRYNRLTYIIIPLIVAGLLFILLFCRRIVTLAISPLNRLLKQSQRIAEGYYDEHIPHTQRRDAVGRLQNSFATMQESLDRHISDIERMNAQTASRNEELTQANRLAEEAARQKTSFIQNMTHQIRTPLNIIMGFAQVLRDSIQMLSVDEVKNITEMMNHNAMTLNRMVLMLYDSSDTGLSEELKNLQPEEVACNEIARESIATTLQRYPNLTIHFESTLPDSLCIHTNRLYLVRSLREILYNSAKYSDGQHISLRVSEHGDMVRFVMEDTGLGMDADYYDLMYKPFTKVNELSEGLGLGLPLTKRHCINLGGDLTLDTDYHEGCRFIIDIPKR